jgi:hypothetical protein
LEEKVIESVINKIHVYTKVLWHEIPDRICKGITPEEII